MTSKVDPQINQTLVRYELISTLYRQVPRSLIAHVLASIVMHALLWGQLHTGLAIGWLIALYLACAGRYASYFWFRTRVRYGEPQLAETVSLVFTLLFGVIWGLSVWFFLMPGEITTLVLVTVIVMGLGAGGSISLAPHKASCLAFVLPTQLSLIVVLVWAYDPLTIAVAVLAGYALAANLLNSFSVHEELRKNVQLSQQISSLRDDAERKNQLLETTLENINQGIALSDADGELRMCNERFFDLLKLDRHTVHRMGEALARVGASLGQPRMEVNAQGAVLEIVDRDLPDRSHVVTVSDVSQLVRRERDLERALSEAESANQAKTRFLAAASHDLRQPIHALGLFFQSLLDRIDTPEVAPIMGKIHTSIEVVDEMLDALLDISKLDAGVVYPTFSRVSLRGLLDRLNAQYQPEPGSQVRLKVIARDVYVHSDEFMLERVLRNLIANALRYTPRGRVLVGVRIIGDQARIEVHDTGVGIAQHELNDIFLEFHQLSNPERDRRQGLGLGLAIVKRISTLLAHPLHVKSTPGRGSTFSITVPLAGGEQESIAPLVNTEDIQRREFGDKRVLVLDDDAAILDAMTTLLSGWSIKVVTAASTDEACEKLVDGQLPDVLIVDYRLRGLETGLDAVNQLRAHLGVDVPVLFITGETAPERLRDTEDAGYPLLHKPVRPAILRATLRQLLKSG